MRIVSGRFGGRRLASVRGDIRPTSDRLRESLFSFLGESVVDSFWIDLYSGTGAVGLEALSRGARFVLFNDKAPPAVRLIKKNLELCRVSLDFEVHCKDGFVILRKPPVSGTVDFLFLDPPYRFNRYDKLLQKAVLSPVFSLERSVICLEIFKKTRVDFLPGNLSLERTLESGDSHLIILRGIP